MTARRLDLPPVLAIEEGPRADALLRCVQEVVTNTTRHAAARNLWITITAGTDGIVIRARDDGRGAKIVSPGNGLTGMRERFEALGGRIELSAAEGQGFDVRGVLP
jgi:signal transduction histidine kinase